VSWWTAILWVSQIPGEIVVNPVSMKLCIVCVQVRIKLGRRATACIKRVAPLTSVCIAELFFPDVQALHAGILA